MPSFSSLTKTARTSWARIEAALCARPLLWAFVLSAVIAAVFTLTLSPGYETNDDVFMQSAVDGNMGEPFPHLIFSNVLIGLLLSTLYRAVEWFPWYGLYLYLAHFASLLAVVYVVLAVRRGRRWVRLVSLAAVLAVFHLPMWMQLQFTSTAILLGASGVMLFFAVAGRSPTRWPAIALSGGLVGFSSWIRWHSAWAVILLALPALALTVRRIPWRRLAVFTGTATVILLAGSLAEAVYYAGQPGWQAYFELNAVRDRIQQSPAVDDLDEAVLAEVGWSRNDLRMFRRWFFTDPEVHEAGDIEAISAALPTVFRSDSALAGLVGQGRGWSGSLRLAVITCLGGLAWAEAGRRGRVLVLAGAAAFIVIAFALAGATRLPTRVSLPMLAFLPLLFLAANGTKEGPVPAGTGAAGKAWRLATAVVSVGALVVGGVNARALDETHHTEEAELRRTLDGLAAVDPNGLFVEWANQINLSYQQLSPWRRGGLGGPALLGLGWQQRSPMHESMLAAEGIDDLYAAIATRPDVYLPLRTAPRVTLYLRYLEEHYGFSGLLVPTARFGEYTVFHLVAAYRVDDRAGTITERRFDGTATIYPLDLPGAAGSTVSILPWGRSTIIVGSVDAELVLVTRRGEGVALAMPDPSLTGGSGSPGFAVTVPGGRAPVRVFALSGGRATEITP